MIEFFFLVGSRSTIPAQQGYISANYTHASSYLAGAWSQRGGATGPRRRSVDGVPRYSLSCNTDTTLDVLQARRDGRAAFELIAQVIPNCRSCRARAIWLRRNSTRCWTAPIAIFRCSFSFHIRGQSATTKHRITSLAGLNHVAQPSDRHQQVNDALAQKPDRAAIGQSHFASHAEHMPQIRCTLPLGAPADCRAREMRGRRQNDGAVLSRRSAVA